MEDQLMQQTTVTNASGSPILNQVSSSSLIVYNGSLINDEYLNRFPPGYRFRPRDDELIVYYLDRKVRNEPLPRNKIRDVNLYNYTPETITEKYKTHGEKEWYFFTPRDRKYPNGHRPNRAAGDGYWKATGADKCIKFHDAIIGFRKALVYHTGKPPKGDKTSWIMHEYRVSNPPKSQRLGNNMRLDDWVLCRIYKKAEKSDGTSNQRRDDEIETQQVNNEIHSEHMSTDENSVKAFGESSMPIDDGDVAVMNSDYDGKVEPVAFFDPYDDCAIHHHLHGFAEDPQSLSLPFDDQAMTNTGFSYPNHNNMSQPVSSELPLEGNQEALHGASENMHQEALLLQGVPETHHTTSTSGSSREYYDAPKGRSSKDGPV